MPLSAAGSLRGAALASAVIEGVASLTLLAVSAWFICACAAAGHHGAAAGFNYVAPAALIRGLAIARIAGGYAAKYLGHRVLLADLAALRQRVMAALFSGTAGPGEARAAALLQQACERVASSDSAILAPRLATLVQLAGVVLFVALLLPGLIAPWLALCAGLCVAQVVLQQLARRAVAARESAAQELDARLQRWLVSCPLWSLRDDWADGTSIRRAATHFAQRRRALDALLDDATLLLQLLGMALAAWLAVTLGAAPPQALAAIPVLLALALRDWLAPGVAATIAAEEAREGRRRLPLARVTGSIGDDHGFPGDAHGSLCLEAFCWQRGRQRGAPLSATLTAPGLALLEGSSGSGKSSLLLALSGELASTGGARWCERDLSGYDERTRRALFYHGEQFSRVLSDTLAHNLRLANATASNAQLREALDWSELGYLCDGAGLRQWIGAHGRELSGGERKRLVLARARLSPAPVWLLDEPFEGLDAPCARRLAAKLQAVAGERLVLIASHLLPEGLCPDHRLPVSPAT